MGDWVAERMADARRALARYEGYRRAALARADERQVAWAEGQIVRTEELLGRLALPAKGRPLAAPLGDGRAPDEPPTAAKGAGRGEVSHARPPRPRVPAPM